MSFANVAKQGSISDSALDSFAPQVLNGGPVKQALLVLAVMLLYALHQDFWLWSSARPLVLGLLPVGLFYHACYTLAASLLMALLVALAWPSRLEAEAERHPEDGPR